jgi:hypothetical protein
MVQFESEMVKYGRMGEKTGWTVIELPCDITEQLNPAVRKPYRVKGLIDGLPIQSIAIIPIGGGTFVLPLNAVIRKAIGKKQGAMVKLWLTLDTDEYQLNKTLLDCLNEFKVAKNAFFSKPRSHQNYYSKWVETAKTQATIDKRIVQIIDSLERGLTYPEMLKEQSSLRKELKR